MVCKITFCSEFPDILNKAGRVTRRRTQAIEKRFAFHANAINIKKAYKVYMALILIEGSNIMVYKNVFVLEIYSYEKSKYILQILQ